MHLDPVLHQHHRQTLRHAGIVRGVKHDLRRAAPPRLHAVAPEGVVVAQDPFPVPGRRERRLDRGGELLEHPVGVGEQVAIVPPQPEPAGAGLLEGHPERALPHGPHVHVAGVEQVEDLAIEVGDAALVEPGCDGRPDHVHQRDLPLAVPRVGRRGGGRKEVGGVAAHLVKVRNHLRPVLEEQVDLAPGLRLALDEHVAVEVEQVMVRASAGPRLVVLGGDRGLVRPSCLRDPVLIDKAISPVGVLERVDQDQRFGQDQLDIGIPGRRQQVVRLGHGRAAPADLVAVDRMHERGHDRQLRDQGLGLVGGEAARIAQAGQPGLDLVQTRHALRRSDHQSDQGAALPARAVAHQVRAPGSRFGQRFDVADHIGGRRDRLAEVVARHLLQRRDVGIVAGAGGQVGGLDGRVDCRGEG